MKPLEFRSLGDPCYYPFGMVEPGRSFTLTSFDYGFNNKLNDNDIEGNFDWQDYGMREYLPRVGRFISVDPLTRKYPRLSTYQFASNSPVSGVDLDGLEYYYAADGTYLGQGFDPNNQEVRLGKLNGHTKTGNLIIQAVDIQGKANKSWTLIHNNHDEFQQVAALGYNENTQNPTSQQATDDVVLNRNKEGGKWGSNIDQVLGRFAGSNVGTTNEDRMNDPTGTYSNYAIYMNTAEALRENQANMKTATMGAIKAFLGEDITNGATYEKGADFYTSDLNPKTGRLWKDYSQNYLDNGFKWGNDVGLFQGTANPGTLHNQLGRISKSYMLLGTASYGANVYAKDNPDDTLGQKK